VIARATTALREAPASDASYLDGGLEVGVELELEEQDPHDQCGDGSQEQSDVNVQNRRRTLSTSRLLFRASW